MKNHNPKKSKKQSKNESVNRIEVENLIVELFEHPASPEWLLDAMWDVLSSHSTISANNPEYVRLMLKFTNFNDNSEVS